MAAGRLSPEKGHALLIRAFARAVEGETESHLVLLGKGGLEDSLRKIAAEAGVERRVLFAGHRENPSPWIARADLFVLPSHWEGFPNALLEAMALGVASISTDCSSGPRELLAPATDPGRKTDAIERTAAGWLVAAPESGDDSRCEELLARAMRELLDDATLRQSLAEGARRRAENFEPIAVFPDWLELIGDRGE